MKTKENKGITLIALVITIIVIVILATISITAVLGENGLLMGTQIGKDEYERGRQQEEAMANQVLDYISNIIEERIVEDLPEITPETPAGVEVKKLAGWSDKVIAISDGNGKAIPLPNGFQYIEGDYDTGIVISDQSVSKNRISTYANTSELQGNEFVWIPVESEEDLKRATFNNNGQASSAPSSDYMEPQTNSNFAYPGETEAYNTMKEQVLKYNGFYIGRYEAGDGTNGTTMRNGKTEAHEVVIKKGVAPYNYVDWGPAVNNIGTAENPSGAAYLAANMYHTSDSVVSTLVYGCQWDAMCRYIGDSQRSIMGGKVQLTGSVETDKSKNIYDLAGNCTEWTMESMVYNLISRKRVTRGGLGGTSSYLGYAISYRDEGFLTYEDECYGFRISLYIKD